MDTVFFIDYDPSYGCRISNPIRIKLSENYIFHNITATLARSVSIMDRISIEESHAASWTEVLVLFISNGSLLTSENRPFHV